LCWWVLLLGWSKDASRLKWSDDVFYFYCLWVDWSFVDCPATDRCHEWLAFLSLPAGCDWLCFLCSISLWRGIQMNGGVIFLREI
jgi:hypothetical protein